MDQLYHRIYLIACHSSIQYNLCKLEVFSRPERFPWLRVRFCASIRNRLTVFFGLQVISSAAAVLAVLHLDVAVLVTAGRATTVARGTWMITATGIRRCCERSVELSENQRQRRLNKQVLRGCCSLVTGQREHSFPTEQRTSEPGGRLIKR